jgi:hypothetical protein
VYAAFGPSGLIGSCAVRIVPVATNTGFGILAVAESGLVVQESDVVRLEAPNASALGVDASIAIMATAVIAYSFAAAKVAAP